MSIKTKTTVRRMWAARAPIRVYGGIGYLTLTSKLNERYPDDIPVAVISLDPAAIEALTENVAKALKYWTVNRYGRYYGSIEHFNMQARAVLKAIIGQPKRRKVK